MIGQNTKLRGLATLLEATPVKTEDIARQIRASSQEQFDTNFAQRLVQEKLKLAKLKYSSGDDTFPFTISQDKGYIVGVSPKALTSDNRRSSLNMYIDSLLRNDDFKKSEGMILCLPYLMNGKDVRDHLYRELPIGFVNLTYDNRSLERRFRQYCYK